MTTVAEPTKTQQAQQAANEAYYNAMIAGLGASQASSAAYAAAAKKIKNNHDRIVDLARQQYLHADEDKGGRSRQGKLEDKIKYLQAVMQKDFYKEHPIALEEREKELDAAMAELEMLREENRDGIVAEQTTTETNNEDAEVQQPQATWTRYEVATRTEYDATSISTVCSMIGQSVPDALPTFVLQDHNPRYFSVVFDQRFVDPFTQLLKHDPRVTLFNESKEWLDFRPNACPGCYCDKPLARSGYCYDCCTILRPIPGEPLPAIADDKIS